MDERNALMGPPDMQDLIDPLQGDTQVAQAPSFQIRQNGNGTLSVVNIRTGQVMSTHQDPGSARNAAASWNASSRRPY